MDELVDFSSNYVYNDCTVAVRDGRGMSGCHFTPRSEEMCNGALTSLQDEEKK